MSAGGGAATGVWPRDGSWKHVNAGQGAVIALRWCSACSLSRGRDVRISVFAGAGETSVEKTLEQFERAEESGLASAWIPGVFSHEVTIEMEYSEKFKSRMVAKMVGPRAVSASALAAEVGLSQPTLSRWLREARRRLVTGSP